MSKHLRNAVDRVKSFYIKKITESGMHSGTHQELNELTVSELEMIYYANPLIIMKKSHPKVSQNIYKSKNNVRKYNTMR